MNGRKDDCTELLHLYIKRDVLVQQQKSFEYRRVGMNMVVY